MLLCNITRFIIRYKFNLNEKMSEKHNMKQDGKAFKSILYDDIKII